MVELARHKTIGLLLSGGIVSAFLLHQLCEINDQSHFILLTLDTRDGCIPHMKKIISHTNFNNNTYESIIVPFKNEYTPPIINGQPIINLADKFKANLEAFKKSYQWVTDNFLDKVDVLYSGNTKNPPIALQTHFAAPDRSGSETVEKNVFKFTMPFIQSTKKDIIDSISGSLVDYVGRNNVLLDYIVNYSHTCTQIHFGRCNQCWQCKEREWAFSENNLTDTGVN